MRPLVLPVTLGLVACLHTVVSGDVALGTSPFTHTKTNNAQAGAPGFRVIRSLSGSKGNMQGSQFVIEDPRTVFHVPQDRQVIVYFEWEGPPGPHHFQGSWRNPEGKVVMISDFQYVAPGSRFSGYWTLTLPEMITTGLWALDAQIDGQPAGVHSFEITTGPGASPPPAPVPTPAEVYQRAVAASVFIDKIDATGELAGVGSGFFIAPGVLLTAFQVIDGASSLRLEFPDGSRASSTEVLAWNRWQDWALLRVEGRKVQPLERAQPNSWRVGDNCYVLGSPSQGSRTIENVSITGTQGSQEAGERLNLSWYGEERVVGSPLLDSYGRVVGVVGGSLVPGAESVRRLGSSSLSSAMAIPGNPGRLLAVPVSSVPEPTSSHQAVTLAELAARGQFITPLPRKTQAYFGSLCKDYRRVGGVAIVPVETTAEFSHRDGALGIVVTWVPTLKVKTTHLLRVYDLNNRMVGESPRGKIELKPQITAYSAWKISIGSLQPGFYRVEVLLGEEPQWRAFFRVIE